MSPTDKVGLASVMYGHHSLHWTLKYLPVEAAYWKPYEMYVLASNPIFRCHMNDESQLSLKQNDHISSLSSFDLGGSEA